MAESFVVLWSVERCRWLQRVGDRGPLEVIFGGPHISLPSIERVAVGDTIYPVLVQRGSLYVVAGMEVQAITSPEHFVQTRLGMAVAPDTMWDELFDEWKRSQPSVGHRLPTTCADRAAVSDAGTEIRFDRSVPAALLASLTLGPQPGREQPLKGISQGQLKHSFSLQGHVRRLSAGSAEILAGLL